MEVGLSPLGLTNTRFHSKPENCNPRLSTTRIQYTTMNTDKICQVEAQEDFVEKLTVTSPAQAPAELIWNGQVARALRAIEFVGGLSFGVGRAGLLSRSS